MNYKTLSKNINAALNTTAGLSSAIKKLLWIYNIKGKLGLSKTPVTIHFKYNPPLGSFKLKVRNNGGSDSFILSEVFDLECYKTTSERAIEHIIDLGSNAGFTAVYFSKYYPAAKLALVEPMPNNLELLKSNLQLNTISATVFEGAISVDSEDILMTISDNDYGHKVENIEYGKMVGHQTLKVKAFTMQDIIDQLKWPHIDLLKIDIEGYEGVLLKINNSWLTRVRMIIMEIHEGVKIEEIKEIMLSYSFDNIREQGGNWIFSKTIE